RIAEDAPAAQSARAEFHPSLKPAHDVLVCQQIGDVIAEPVFAGELSILCVGRIEVGLDLTRRETRAQQRPALAVPRLGRAFVVEQLIPDELGNAERTASVA